VHAARAAASRHRIVGIVRPQPAASPRTARASLRRLAARMLPGLSQDGLAAVAAAARAPIHTLASPDPGALAAIVRETRPDLICVAGFPWLLPRDVFDSAPLGAINVHGSLLPRHRGVLPLFWIYYHDDRMTGVTVHHIDDGADTGDILAQDSFPLERGLSVDLLNHANALHGAALLPDVLDGLEAGTVQGTPQDHGRATRAPRPRGGPMVNFAQWDVERVWHFLAGLQSRYREPLRDAAGRNVTYTRVRGWQRTAHARAPGTVLVAREGEYDLFCREGIVHLAAGNGRPRRP
jgi:methionyl-tRNA formyltransferase